MPIGDRLYGCVRLHKRGDECEVNEAPGDTEPFLKCYLGVLIKCSVIGLHL